jgi:hypothetical protein
MMGQPRRKKFIDHVGSPLTLAPFVLGVGAAIILWAMSDKRLNLAAFSAIVGTLGAVGMLLTLTIVHSRPTDPALLRRRREMLALVTALGDDVRSASPESDRTIPPALTERA